MCAARVPVVSADPVPVGDALARGPAGERVIVISSAAADACCVGGPAQLVGVVAHRVDRDRRRADGAAGLVGVGPGGTAGRLA